MIESLVFDWSGTLADDFDATLAATNRTLEALGGLPVDRETYRSDFVLPVMGFYEPRIPGKTLDEIDETFFAAMDELKAPFRLFDGAEALLRTAKARGIKLFILSTMATRVLEQGVAELGIADLFDGIYGDASDKSAVMPRLLQENGLQADRTVFAGDTPHDMQVGRASGVCLAASLYGYTADEKMLAERPDFVMHSLADLARGLDRDHLFETQKLVISTVGGIARRDDGRILLVRTTKWSNTYGIPGGKIDYGETMVAAYEREMKEETGLDVTNSRFIMIQDCIESKEFVKPRHFLLINYISDVADPDDLVTNYEIAESLWVDPRKAMSMNLNEPTRIVLEEAARQGLVDIGEGVS